MEEVKQVFVDSGVVAGESGVVGVQVELFGLGVALGGGGGVRFGFGEGHGFVGVEVGQFDAVGGFVYLFFGLVLFLRWVRLFHIIILLD